MRRIPFRTVMEQALAVAGYNYSSAQAGQLESLCNYINMRVQSAWDWAPWPELVRIEERAFAAPYEASRTYGEGDVVWYAAEEAYFEALSTTQGNAPTNATYWEETTTPAELLVEWEQYGLTKMARVWQVYTKDPRTAATALKLDHVETRNGVVVPKATGTTVWVKYTEPAYRYTAVEHNGAAAYSRYDLVYYPASETASIFPDRGEVYEAELDSNGVQVWELVPFPAFLSLHVTRAAGADVLRYYGQLERALEYDGLAAQALQDEWDKVRAYQTAEVVVND